MELHPDVQIIWDKIGLSWSQENLTGIPVWLTLVADSGITQHSSRGIVGHVLLQKKPKFSNLPDFAAFYMSYTASA